VTETVILGAFGTGDGTVTLTFTSPSGGGTSNIASIINGVKNVFASVLFGSSVVQEFSIDSGNSLAIEVECVANAPCEYTLSISGGTVGGQASETTTGQALNSTKGFTIVAN
jgi:hypothetical protein